MCTHSFAVGAGSACPKNGCATADPAPTACIRFVLNYELRPSNLMYLAFRPDSTRKSMRCSSNYNSPSKLEGVPVGGGRVSVKSSFSHTPPA